MAFRLRCKFCCAEVADSRERRCLHATSSEEVQSALRKVLVGKGCSEAAAKQHFQSGYVCKKCFLLVKKYNRLVMDIKEVEKEMEKTINSTAAIMMVKKSHYPNNNQARDKVLHWLHLQQKEPAGWISFLHLFRYIP